MPLGEIGSSALFISPPNIDVLAIISWASTSWFTVIAKSSLSTWLPLPSLLSTCKIFELWDPAFWLLLLSKLLLKLGNSLLRLWSDLVGYSWKRLLDSSRVLLTSLVLLFLVFMANELCLIVSSSVLQSIYRRVRESRRLNEMQNLF